MPNKAQKILRRDHFALNKVSDLRIISNRLTHPEARFDVSGCNEIIRYTKPTDNTTIHLS
jgi:hypothetical protein